MSRAHHIRHYCRLLFAFACLLGVFEFTIWGLPKRLHAGAPIALDYLFLVALLLAFVVAPFLLYPLGGGARRQELGIRVVFWAVPLLGFGFAALLWNASLPNGATPSVIMISGILATMGWLITQRNARNAAKKQHTMTLLMNFTTSDFIRFHGTNVARLYPYATPLPTGDLHRLRMEREAWRPTSGDSKEDMPTLTSVVHLLNFYEFIAIGVIRGDLDEAMTKELLRSVVCSICIKYAAYIREQQRTAAGPARTKAFIGLTTVFEEWATDAERAKAAFEPADLPWRHLQTINMKRLGLRLDISKC